MKAAPKKETARIQVPPDAKRPMPQSTLKMQQTQPMAATPAPAMRKASLSPAITPIEIDDDEEDPMIKILSWVVLAVSLAAAAVGYLAFSA
jgi:hypothetical protein